MPDFVTVTNARGVKQRIPAHWMDHPVLSKGFKPLPSAAVPNPSTSSAAAPAAAKTPPAGDTTEKE